ncbi:hydrogenase maturation protease [Fontisphaera persica]|jgi:hydrogenase maturation protease|uniref:hydrogenase maturation protease n=1 Tax=Fontisphaera persica TaxID=2974023 RepID=UPI0024BFBC22|nr:hydrogenase maturation protease [Fontisphaera persica]WCJ60679.1 hydrogenase maturation protease [Fontisphaera persica]
MEAVLRGHTAVVGVGNPDHGDDGAGVRLAERLLAAGCANVFVAGVTPEQTAPSLARLGFERLLFLDAVDFGGAPGSVVLLGGREIQSRFPQVSTHKLSLGTLARMLELDRGTQVWLLGMQPLNLNGTALSEVMEQTVQALACLLQEIIQPAPPGMAK